MNKIFNTTGLCIPELNYMVDISSKLDKMQDMVNKGQYFVINRPRQYGKTTAMYLLEERVKEEYLVISCSFEGIGNNIFSEESYFSKKILELLADSIEFTDDGSAKLLREINESLEDLMDVSKAITKFIKRVNKKVVLFIDEVDKSSNNQLFLNFLGMLRSKFLLARQKKDITFHSVILAGIHDIKNLKLKIRDDEELKQNSPWNIAVNFDVDMSFNIAEIETMLCDYCNDNNLVMDNGFLAERLFYYTNGYPFLVSRLCQIIHEELVVGMRAWNLEDIDSAVKEILKERNTLFDDLIKNIENNRDIYSFVEGIILLGNEIPFTQSEKITSLCSMYGIIKNDDVKCKINNRIFELLLYNHMTARVTRENKTIQRYNFKDNFINEDNSLNIKRVLIKFQQFMKEQYSSIDSEFIEREGRLLFLAFIKPIINGVGFDFKEVQISEEKRLDIVITYNNFKYIIELKIWRGEKYHKNGLKQLGDYLEIHGMDRGFLVVFNFNQNKAYKEEVVIENNKEIFTVYL